LSEAWLLSQAASPERPATTATGITTALTTHRPPRRTSAFTIGTPTHPRFPSDLLEIVGYYSAWRQLFTPILELCRVTDPDTVRQARRHNSKIGEGGSAPGPRVRYQVADPPGQIPTDHVVHGHRLQDLPLAGPQRDPHVLQRRGRAVVPQLLRALPAHV